MHYDTYIRVLCILVYRVGYCKPITRAMYQIIEHPANYLNSNRCFNCEPSGEQLILFPKGTNTNYFELEVSRISYSKVYC